ncbi:hypothetical protein TrRE_jg2322 [Triparma retinervis]|uniref:PH domain-containing protein n=1 Tax=Triparma retinervis TaxID=2557542 RepID=A0A9W7G7C8_9STRA|nr:hypothetical protein TrRE_jg2322 [Triparma retinervis]
MSVSDDSSILSSISNLDQFTLRLASCPDPTDRTGTMWKRGRGKKFSFIRPWARRVFVLDCSKRKLEYKGPHDSDEPDKKGQVILDGGASVKPLSSSNSKFPKGANFGFEILTADGALELALENEEDMKSWMRTIQNAIQQDMISEAKIQKKIYDDHVKRQNDRREAREKRKEEEADALLNSVIVKSTQNKVLEKQASSIQRFDEEPSRESLEAEALLLGAITGKVRAAPSSGASSLQHSQSFKVGNKTTVVEVDVSGVHDDVLRKQAEGERQRKEAERKRTEMVRIYEQMEERKKKANELRRKHQVRQNFKSAVRRAVIQHKFISQMQEKTKETRKAFGYRTSKYDEKKILFEQGEGAEMSNKIERMLARKKLEKQLQDKADASIPPPPMVMDSFRSSEDPSSSLFVSVPDGADEIMRLSSVSSASSTAPPPPPQWERKSSGMPPAMPPPDE